MKQVKLKIEEFFSDEVIFRIEFEKSVSPVFINKVYDVIYLEKTKSNKRESVIKALWELQKSLLPDKPYYSNVKNCNRILHVYGEGIYFYDPSSRIITITDFGGE